MTVSDSITGQLRFTLSLSIEDAVDMANMILGTVGHG